MISGVVLEMIVALACIGTAVVLYPVVKRQNEGVALGFVGVRVLEAGTIVAGVVILMSLVTLRQAGAGADALVTGEALVAMHNWAFLLGQGFLPARTWRRVGATGYDCVSGRLGVAAISDPGSRSRPAQPIPTPAANPGLASRLPPRRGS